MRAFDLDRQIIDRYEEFSRSFAKIRADDLRAEISRQYEQGRFWPDALLSFNLKDCVGSAEPTQSV